MTPRCYCDTGISNALARRLYKTQDQVIDAVLADIDGRVEAVTSLNSSLATTYAQVADNMASQHATTESDRYIESYGVLRSFVRNVVQYASNDHQVPKSSLVDKGWYVYLWAFWGFEIRGVVPPNCLCAVAAPD